MIAMLTECLRICLVHLNGVGARRLRQKWHTIGFLQVQNSLPYEDPTNACIARVQVAPMILLGPDDCAACPPGDPEKEKSARPDAVLLSMGMPCCQREAVSADRSHTMHQSRRGRVPLLG